LDLFGTLPPLGAHSQSGPVEIVVALNGSTLEVPLGVRPNSGPGADRTRGNDVTAGREIDGLDGRDIIPLVV